jgi:hypothetical protein
MAPDAGYNLPASERETAAAAAEEARYGLAIHFSFSLFFSSGFFFLSIVKKFLTFFL